MPDDDFVHPRNYEAWVIGTYKRGPGSGFRVRRVVWGLTLAKEEARPGEQIRRAKITVERQGRHHGRNRIPTDQ